MTEATAVTADVTDGYVRVCAVDDLPTVGAVQVEIEGKAVAVVRDSAGNIHAIDDTCSHANVSLSEGDVEDSAIECWLHGSRFDLRTGLVVPLGLDGTGVLAVFSRDANAFDADAVTILSTIARYAGPAVENAFRFLDVQELAATDLRTGVGSALAFEEALPREISAARRYGRPLSLIQVDLDDFGEINKKYSQEVGNDVLAEFGERVLTTIRGSDAAFRNSGGADEFFLILPDTTREFAKLLYGRLAFEMAARPFGEVGPVTMSGGLVELRPDDTPETLQARSGALIRLAKDGKSRLCDDGT